MILDSGVGSPHKVLEASMGEAGWPAEPTRGRKAQPRRALTQLGGMVASRGVHSLFDYCIHMRLRPIYWGVIYLAKNIIRYCGIFLNKGKCLYFNTPIMNHNFLKNH